MHALPLHAFKMSYTTTMNVSIGNKKRKFISMQMQLHIQSIFKKKEEKYKTPKTNSKLDENGKKT